MTKELTIVGAFVALSSLSGNLLPDGGDAIANVRSMPPPDPPIQERSQNSSDGFRQRIKDSLGDQITQNDLDRLSKWGAALLMGRNTAAAAGYKADLESRNPLFEQQAGLGGSVPAGLYSCSVTKLGHSGQTGIEYIAYPPFRCRVVDHKEKKHFTKLTGSQLTAGWIYPVGDKHSVYVGTAFYGYEDRASAYGKSEKRDQAAVVERIGPKRWRMVFPYPYYESVVNVMELKPVGE